MDKKYKVDKLLAMFVGDEKEEIEIPRDYYLILGAFISKFNKDDFPELQLRD